MNKLEIQNGGMPFEGDDINWLDSAYREGMKGVVDLFANPHDGFMVLSGMTYSDDDFNVTINEGFCLLDYEICFFPQTVLPSAVGANLPNISIHLITSYDASGLEAFADGQSKDTYQIRQAQAVVGLLGSNEIVLVNAPRLDAQITTVVESQGSEVTIGSFLNNWSTGGEIVKARKLLGFVDLRGKIDEGTTNDIVFNLSSSYRPPNEVIGVCSMTVSPYIARIKIATNGDVTILTDTNITIGSGEHVSLHGVRYYCG